MIDVAVIGAGPAGLMAAGTAVRAGREVTVFDANGTALKKLSITGKGRCNLTNNCDTETLISNVTVNARFLRSAFARFSSSDTMALFEDLGVALKTERGGRVFPVSDKAGDICAALRRYASGANVVKKNVSEIITSDGAVCAVRAGSETFECGSVILATGGLSYPATGSTGDGYSMAVALGHTIKPVYPSLVPLVSPDPVCAQMQGLSLKNVRLRMFESGKVIFDELGEMLFTHFGISGPLVLSASSRMRLFGTKTYEASIDLKPALSNEMLDKRILRDFETEKNRDFKNSLSALLPLKLIPVAVSLSGIDERIKVNSITRTQREALVRLIKDFRIKISGKRTIDEAIITSGGVSTSEIDPKTMESKLVKGLYFAGEIIDTDAYTGGFNLQIAWSTGHAAGEAV